MKTHELKYTLILYDLKKKIKSLKGKNIKLRVEISGGEPLMYSDIFPLIENILDLDEIDYISILSNLELVKNMQSDLKNLKKISSKKIIFVTAYYHHKPEIHDYISGRKGSFIDKTKGVHLLVSMGYLVHFKTLITRLNYDQIEALVEFLIDEFDEITNFTFSVHGLDITGNALRYAKEIAVSYTECMPHIEEFLDYLESSGLIRKIKVHLFSIPLCLLDPYYWKYAGISEALTTYALYLDAQGNRVEDQDLRDFPSSKCSKCALYYICPKPWKSYVEYFGDKELNPISPSLGEEYDK